MNVKKSQMHLQLKQQQQQQQQQQTLQRRHNRTGFETLLDQSQSLTVDNKSLSSSPVVSRNASAAGGPLLQWSIGSPDDRRHHHQHQQLGQAHQQLGQAHQHHHHRYRSADDADFANHARPMSPVSPPRVATVADTAPADFRFANGGAACSPGRLDEQVTTPTSPSQLSLPSPYYDRNPIVAFPLHHQHHHHHHHHQHGGGGGGPKSPVSVTSTTVTVPLANVQNVVYPASDQDLHNDLHHYGTNGKYYSRHVQQHQINFKPGLTTNGRDDDKENIKQSDAECLQQQLDEVLKACVDYEERNKNRQQQPATVSAESSGNPPPTTTPPQQNRIKTNGSLPRDSGNKSSKSTPTSPTPSLLQQQQFSMMTSTPTSPSSPPPPSSSTSVTSPQSPSSPIRNWPTTTTEKTPPPSLSPLMLHAGGGDDSVFLENSQTLQVQSTQQPKTCGSPRSRIRTLVQSCPITANSSTATTTAATDSYYGSSKDTRMLQHHDRQRSFDSNGREDGPKISPTDLLLSKLPVQQQQLSSASLQSAALQPHSWQTTTSTWLRSSPFTADVNVSADGPSSLAATNRATEAAEQRRKLLVELSAFKSRLVELHLRREEVDRELIIETALLHAELDAADDETRQSDNIVDGLDRAVAECRQQMDVCTVQQQEQRTAADLQLAGLRRTLQGLRSRLESIEDDDVTKGEIRASIDQQTELLDTEQKLYEDVEFGLLEEEAGWLARREELHRDRAAAVAVRRARRARAEWLRAQLDQLRSVGDDQLRALRADINTVTLSIQQGHKKLQELDAIAGTTSPSTNAQDHYRRQQFQYDSQNYSSEQQPKSLEWSWDQQRLKSPMSPVSSSSMSWDVQSKSPVSPWSPGSSNNAGFSSSPPYNNNMEAVANNSLMTSSMTTTCCSSIASSGGEDDGCRQASDDSTSRMSMSTIFDGGAEIKLRSKVKSPSDITKRPLTRYLPIRYDGDGGAENLMAFDLRAHIESAGHQLDDDGTTAADRHFWIDSTSCRGYLKKLSGAGTGKGSRRSGRKWLKRWFVFDRQSRTLSYYHRRSDDVIAVTQPDNHHQRGDSEKKPRPRASIRFQDIQEVYVDHTNSSKGLGCSFVVKTAQRTFYLSAATGQAVRVWVDVIFTGAEGYREYLKTSNGGGGPTTPGNDDRLVRQTKS